MRAEKKQMVQELVDRMNGQAVVLITYQGVTANSFNSFRAKVANDSVKGACHVVPNTLLKKAAAELGYTALAEQELSGDTAMVTGADAVALVKAIKEFASDKEKAKEKVKVKLSYVEGQLLNAKDTLALADLPPKEVIQAQLLGLIQAPAAGIARAINAKLSSVVYVLDSLRKKLEEGQTA